MKKSGSESFGIDQLEVRRLMSASLTVSQSLMVFNAVENSSPSPVETLTLTNTGDAALSLTSLSIVNDPSQVNQGAARFAILNTASEPSSLAPGGSFGVQLDYSATAAELDYALLDISTSDPVNPLQQVQLHGIGTTGLGGGNQPSLERILQAYDEPNYNDVGETNVNSAYYPEPPGSNSDEVDLQELVKAGSGPVTIDVLASFTAASTKPYTLGWYQTSDPSNTQQQLFYTPTSEYQSVYVQPEGVTSFDPGSSVFGFYNPSATVKVNNQLVTGYTQDDLNTWDTTDPRKFRFFPLENASGTVVPNSYIMTSTEWYNPGGYDFTNIIAIVSNVQAAPSAPGGPVLSISNPVALTGSNTLIFNRIQNQNPTVGDTVHNTNTITIENTGQGNLDVNSITVTATTSSNGGTQYELVNPPTLPFVLSPGQTQSVEVEFVLSQGTANGHSDNETNSAGNGGGGSVYPGILTITSNDANAPTTTLPMEAWWQEHSENSNEPNLQTIVNLMAGYSTEIAASQTPFLPESVGAGTSPTYYGEEVVSSYWAQADSTVPIQVQQIDAYHTQGDTAGLDYYPQGTPSSKHSILSTGSDVGQTFFPLNSSGTNAATGSFTTTSNFGFEVLNPNTYSDDSLNVGDDGGGHLIRFYPVRTASGNIIPNTYILANDYPSGASENFDFNDNVYLISNIKPVSTTAVSPPQTTAGAASPAAISATETTSGVSLQWEPVIDSTLTGYNVYSSLSASTGYSLIASLPTTADSYLDASALPGETVYYRVSAVNSIGVGLGTQTSVQTSGSASTNLQTIAINEAPTGSTTTTTTNSAYTIVAGGPGVTGTTSGFRYLFAAQSGNFDVALQVSSITTAGSYATAGILASDSLSDSGANVYMSASPANYRFKYRSTDGGDEAITAGTTAPTYPDAWVRLTRVGDVFSGYTSSNGIIWTLMSQVTLSSFPTNGYLGIAVASNNTTQTTTAQVANYGNTIVYTGPVTMAQTYSVVGGQTVQESVLENAVDPTGTIEPNSFAITTPPNEGGTATFNSATGLLTYTPASGFVGTETLAYTVSDSNGATSTPTTISFVVASPVPIAANENFQAVAGQPVVLNVLVEDTDSNGSLNPASVSIASDPRSGATLNVNTTTGAITYLAPATFTGTDTFTYTVADEDGAISAPGTVTITVAHANTGGLLTQPVTTTATAGVAQTIDVLAGATDSTSSILPGTVSIVSAPNHGGAATVNSNGTITYTAASTFGGLETFRYTVKDAAGHTSAATLVSVTVSNPGVAPVAANATTTLSANGTFTVSVPAAVASTVGLNLSTMTIVGYPAHGNAAINYTAGTITYIPAANFVGADSFSYTVQDANGHLSNTATVNVNVGVTAGSAAGNDRSVVFTSAGGALTTVSLNRGSVTVLFNTDGTISVSRKGVATISGSALQISGLELTNTTAASTLSITARGSGAINIGSITDTSPIKAILAPRATLTGAMNLSGISTVQLLQITDGHITIAGGIPAGFTLSSGAVSNSTLSSAAAIKTLKVSSWTSSTVGASSITAPSIGALTVAGNFQPSLTLTGGGVALKSAQIRGTLSSDFWDITGAITTLNVTGAITGFNLVTTGNVGTVTASLLSDDALLIGSSPSDTLANASATTLGDATLNALHLTARGKTTFSNTALIVHTLTAATLGAIGTTDTDPNPSGIALLKAKSITGTENGKSFRFTASATASAIFGDFEIDLL